MAEAACQEWLIDIDTEKTLVLPGSKGRNVTTVCSP
jgi:hypothetical protein